MPRGASKTSLIVICAAYLSTLVSPVNVTSKVASKRPEWSQLKAARKRAATEASQYSCRASSKTISAAVVTSVSLVLCHREVDEMIDHRLRPNKLADETDEVHKWLRNDKTAIMTVGITLSDKMLKNVAHSTTALETWNEICNVHQRHTLPNKPSAR
eukprot:IDg19821t1